MGIILQIFHIAKSHLFYFFIVPPFSESFSTYHNILVWDCPKSRYYKWVLYLQLSHIHYHKRYWWLPNVRKYLYHSHYCCLQVQDRGIELLEKLKKKFFRPKLAEREGNQNEVFVKCTFSEEHRQISAICFKFSLYLPVSKEIKLTIAYWLCMLLSHEH